MGALLVLIGRIGLMALIYYRVVGIIEKKFGKMSWWVFNLLAIPYLPVHEATLHNLCGWEFMLSSNAAYFVAFLDPPLSANCFCKNVFQNYSEASFWISILSF